MLGLAGLAHANNITVSNTAQLQNVLGSPNPCSTASAPNACPDTASGAVNTITLTASNDPNGQYQPAAPLNIPANIATNLTIVGPQTAPGAVISGQNIVCPCPFSGPDAFDIQPGATVKLKNLDVRLSVATASAAVDSQGALTIENSSFTQNHAGFVIFVDNANLSSSLTMTNSTITGNEGEGIEAAGDTTLVNDTITS